MPLLTCSMLIRILSAKRFSSLFSRITERLFYYIFKHFLHNNIIMMKNYQQINNDSLHPSPCADPFERSLAFYDNVDGCEVEVNDC